MTPSPAGSLTWSWARTAIGFKPEYLDFRRGIHVGNLEPHERLTRILKSALETRYREPFVTERWGRGVFWQWIGFLPRANRAAMPLSSGVSFGCSKFFVEVDTGDQRFKCGLQIERGYLRAPAESRACRLRPDWDWNRLIKGLTPRSTLLRELKRLAGEGFEVHAGSWSTPSVFTKGTLPGATRLRSVLGHATATEWCGLQVYYALDEPAVQASSGVDLIDTMLAVFDEVTPAMNQCMIVKLRLEPPGPQ
ncbi:MAG: hypothetical protein IMZ44_16705 [Planctomycetes bacterium]|nr:hypothetical protein [Planctomycetota bacterium]